MTEQPKNAVPSFADFMMEEFFRLASAVPTKLEQVKNVKELATFLGTDYKKFLVYYLYRTPEPLRYRKFEIPKKSGGHRQIKTPATALKMIQQTLKAKLEEAHSPKAPAHGFIKGRSIKTNADPHIQKKFVLNVDLNDFFGTINFGRVRGLFLKHPFNLSPQVATVLAQICCHEGALPQGAPTSPIISNLICRRLDLDLKKLAQKYNCVYSRYADDITISTSRGTFPKGIAEIIQGTDIIRSVRIGQELEQIISKNGFSINPTKSRLQMRSDRQEVTGLVTNKIRNVNRRFIRNTRAMLHSWRKSGIEEATRVHYEKDRSHVVSEHKTLPSIEMIVRGRINFIRSIRDENFSAYKKLAKSFNDLTPHAKPLPIPPDAFLHLINQNVFVIKDSFDPLGGEKEGTAFYLEEVEGFVTCEHVFASAQNLQKEVWLYSPMKRTAYKLKLRSARPFPHDLAIFDLSDGDRERFWSDHNNHTPLRMKHPFESPTYKTQIILVGWPQFDISHSVSVMPGTVASTFPRSGLNNCRITAQIIQGNSGGPVLDIDNHVIAVAVKGNNSANSHEVGEYVAILANNILG